MFLNLFFHFGIAFIILIVLFQLTKDTKLYRARGFFLVVILLVYSFVITHQYIELSNSHHQTAVYQYQKVATSLHHLHQNHQLQHAANLRDDVQHLKQLISLSSVMDQKSQEKLTLTLDNIQQSMNNLLTAFPTEEYDRYEDWFADSDFEEFLFQVSTEFPLFNRGSSRNPIGIYNYEITYSGNHLQRMQENSERMLSISEKL